MLANGATLGYKFNEVFSGRAYYSYFFPGSFYDDASDSQWFRVEVTVKF